MNERALIFAGVIVGLAVADQLISLHRLLKRRRDVIWDPLLLWTAALIMVTLVQVWWSIAGARSLPMTIGDFLPMLLGLVLLFLLAAASLPDDATADGTDLRAYYSAQRRYIWALYSLAVASLIVTRLIAERFVQTSFFSFQNLLDAAMLGVMASLILVRNRWWHAVVLTVLTIAGPVLWLSKTLN